MTIDTRFNGPTNSGNGGYCCGLIAAELDPAQPVQSTLRLPPPLGVPLSWEQADGTVRLLTAGGAVVGEATAGSFNNEPPPPVSAEVAAAAQAAYRGAHNHPFATCFTCGPDRDDGLRVFTGPVAGDPLTTAAPWTPLDQHADADGTVSVPVLWAAIDCAGGWTADFMVHPTVLGRMTGQVVRSPKVGEECTVIGYLRAQEGRKFLTATALYAGDELLARSEQVWIEIDPADFNG